MTLDATYDNNLVPTSLTINWLITSRQDYDNYKLYLFRGPLEMPFLLNTEPSQSS
jgi:hypothetical protein